MLAATQSLSEATTLKDYLASPQAREAIVATLARMRDESLAQLDPEARASVESFGEYLREAMIATCRRVPQWRQLDADTRMLPERDRRAVRALRASVTREPVTTALPLLVCSVRARKLHAAMERWAAERAAEWREFLGADAVAALVACVASALLFFARFSARRRRERAPSLLRIVFRANPVRAPAAAALAHASSAVETGRASGTELLAA